MAGRELDYDYLGFTFKGVHSTRDLNIYRTSSSSRYEHKLAPTLTEKTVEATGADGMHFFNTFHKQAQFSVNIAFDRITEATLRKMKQLFNGKGIGELIFDE